jgi:CHASE2 domain-containing sensor protein
MNKLDQEKLVILTLLGDVCENNVSILANINYADGESLSQQGSLAVFDDLEQEYNNWQSAYHNLARSLAEDYDIEVSNQSIDDILNDQEIEQKRQEYKTQETYWLNQLEKRLQSSEFQPIYTKLNNKIGDDDQVRVVIRTNDIKIKKLPWDKWSWLTYHQRKGRVFFSPISAKKQSISRTNQIKILIILGDTNNQEDNLKEIKIFEEYFPHGKILKPLINPSSQEVYDSLQNQNFDILYFGGHSQTDNDIGRIYISEDDYLEISDLKRPLKKAVKNGLKLAIFNSCQGLGLASEVEKNDLQIPNLIVMRDIIHNQVAVAFLEDILKEFVSNKNALHISFNKARQNLEKFEIPSANQYPASSLMPILMQISENPVLLEDWLIKPITYPSYKNFSIGKILSISIIATVVTMIVRAFGALQWLELWTYDFMLPHRNSHLNRDSRILIVTIDEDDLKYQGTVSGNRSLKDNYFAQLLNKLEVIKPKTIGSDIYHNYNFDPNLLTRFQNDKRIFFICKTIAKDTSQSEKVAPPSEIDSGRWGFNDIIPDDDQVIRRHLLTLPPVEYRQETEDPCATSISFSFLLAIDYLGYLEDTPKIVVKEDLNPNINSNQDEVRGWFIDQGYLPNLQKRNAGYQNFDDGATQILFDYYYYDLSLEKGFHQISLSEVLKNGIPQSFIEIFKNNPPIVLIGNINANYKDIHKTPYNQEIDGVFVHAHILSYILRVALKETLPLTWWSWWQDGLWIWGWSFTIIALGSLFIKLFKWRNIWVWVFIGVMAVVVIPVICVFIFVRYSIWVPLVPTSLSLLTTQVILSKYSSLQSILIKEKS